MTKPVFGLALGAVLGVLDGLSGLVSAPEIAPQIASVVAGSTIKGLIVGLLIGFIAQRSGKPAVVIVAGTAIGLFFAYLVTLLNPPYTWQIMLPGAALGLIVGYATVRHRTAVAALVLTAVFFPATNASGQNAAAYAVQASSANSLMDGKTVTEKTIRHEVVVNASPADVFALWTTPEGVTHFFAPAARIELRVGGKYEIIFFPDEDPEGVSHGTAGSRILRIVPGKELAFEWITFAGDTTKGRHAPPYAVAALRDARPIPTWVELSFDQVPGYANKTRVRFAHYGFRSGELWDRSFQWFDRAWAGVLESLAGYIEKENQKD